jgi:hypothetical protein
MRSRRLRIIRPLVAAVLAVGAILALPSRPSAHEVPANVTVLAFVRPEGQRLMLLVRVPLEAIRDVEFPLFGPGYLDIAAVDPLLPDAARLWIADYIVLYEEGRRLPTADVVATRISLPSDRSFASFDAALAHVHGPRLAGGIELPWRQAMLDVALVVPIGSDRSNFSLESGLAHLGVRTTTVLRFLLPGGTERAFQYDGNPGLVRLDPRWHQAFLRFVGLGFRHILDGIDHLLFVLCLVIPFRRFRPLVVIITSFTVAHSITLIASAAGLAPGALWFPPFIETLIALSILVLAFENIAGAAVRRASAEPGAEEGTARGTASRSLDRRWLIAFAFGLVHGFGFSFLLRDSLQFAGAHLATSLLAFNIGVELGQLFVILLAIPVLELLFRRVVAERLGIILVSALVAHTAWHWTTERGSALAQYDFRWPALDLALLATVMRWLMLLLLLAGALWLLFGLFGRLARTGRAREVSSSG